MCIRGQFASSVFALIDFKTLAPPSSSTSVIMQWIPKFEVGDVVYHCKSLRQGKVIAVGPHIMDIEFDAVQKPGVMYEGASQNKAKSDGLITTGRHKWAFVKGSNGLPGAAVLDHEGVAITPNPRVFARVDQKPVHENEAESCGRGTLSWQGMPVVPLKTDVAASRRRSSIQTFASDDPASLAGGPTPP